MNKQELFQLADTITEEYRGYLELTRFTSSEVDGGEQYGLVIRQLDGTYDTIQTLDDWEATFKPAANAWQQWRRESRQGRPRGMG